MFRPALCIRVKSGQNFLPLPGSLKIVYSCIKWTKIAPSVKKSVNFLISKKISVFYSYHNVVSFTPYFPRRGLPVATSTPWSPRGTLRNPPSTLNSRHRAIRIVKPCRAFRTVLSMPCFPRHAFTPCFPCSFLLLRAALS